MRAELDGVDGKSLLEFLMYENVADPKLNARLTPDIISVDILDLRLFPYLVLVKPFISPEADQRMSPCCGTVRQTSKASNRTAQPAAL